MKKILPTLEIILLHAIFLMLPVAVVLFSAGARVENVVFIVMPYLIGALVGAGQQKFRRKNRTASFFEIPPLPTGVSVLRTAECAELGDLYFALHASFKRRVDDAPFRERVVNAPPRTWTPILTESFRDLIRDRPQDYVIARRVFRATPRVIRGGLG